MKAYKLEICVIDFDGLGRDEVVKTIENARFPNDCISPSIFAVTERDIGDWSDDHPLNKKSTATAEYDRIFAAPEAVQAVGQQADEAQGAVADAEKAWELECHLNGYHSGIRGQQTKAMFMRAFKAGTAQPTAEEVQEHRESAGDAGAAQNSSTAPVPRTLENLLDRYWHIAHAEGASGKSQGSVAQEVLNEIRAHFRTQPAAPVSGNAGEPTHIGNDHPPKDWTVAEEVELNRIFGEYQPEPKPAADDANQQAAHAHHGTQRNQELSCDNTSPHAHQQAGVEHAKRAEPSGRPPMGAVSELAAFQYWAAGETEPLTPIGAWQARASLQQQAGGDGVEIDRIKRVAACGTVDSFLALPEQDKRYWFAMAMDESERRKLAEERLAFLHSTNKDTEGFEYGVAKVKHNAAGQLESFLWCLSDHSDIDAAIAAAPTLGGAK